MNQNIKKRETLVFCNDKLYQKTAEIENIDESLVKDIVNCQSLFTKQVIKKGAFEGVRYVYLGKIGARLKKIQKINDLAGKEFSLFYKQLK